MLCSTTFQQLPLERLKYRCRSQALPGEGHRVLKMHTSSPFHEESQGSSQRSVILDPSVAASKESSAVPNGTSRGRKYLSQLLWTLLSYFLRKAWEVPNLLLLLMAGDNSRCTALGIFLQDLICSFEWGQQMHFPRSSVHSLDEKLPTVPVISKGQLWKRPCCEETGKV